MAHYSNKSALARISALQAALNASDSIAEEYAAQHLADGTPAYGWTCKYSNARACQFASAVARLGNVEAAIEELTPFFTMHGQTFDPQPLLNYLLPLNAAAVRDLKLAYENGGSWVTAEELERRTERFELRVTDWSAPVRGADLCPAVAAE